MSSVIAINPHAVVNHLQPNIQHLFDENKGVDFRVVPWNENYVVGDDGSVWCCRTRGGKYLPKWSKMVLVSADRGINRGRHPRPIVGLRSPKLKTWDVGTLIIRVFFGDPPDGMECCHGDGDPFNNKIGNLRWDTHAANMEDKKRHGRNPEGEKNHFRKLTSSQVREIRKRCESGELQKLVAKDYGVWTSCIQKIMSGKTWKCVK